MFHPIRNTVPLACSCPVQTKYHLSLGTPKKDHQAETAGYPYVAVSSAGHLDITLGYYSQARQSSVQRWYLSVHSAGSMDQELT